MVFTSISFTRCPTVMQIHSPGFFPPHIFRTGYSIDGQPEVVPFEKWKELESESKSGLSNWIKDALQGGKSEMQDERNQRLYSKISTSPMWDRLEFEGDRNILGEFIEFKGNQDDMQALRHLKRSKVGRFLFQKTIMFRVFGYVGNDRFDGCRFVNILLCNSAN